MKNSTEYAPQKLLCFSNLRWNDLFQRPKHLISRFAENADVYFMEEPIMDAEKESRFSFSNVAPGIWVIVPHLTVNINKQDINPTLSALLERFLQTGKIEEFAFWYYSPKALAYTEQFHPKFVIYDCMDELSFSFVSSELIAYEKKLMAKADIVFTKRHTYETMQNQIQASFDLPN